MITVIKTGDRDTDLILLQAETKKLAGKKFLRFDGSNDRELAIALGYLEAISFLPSEQIYIIHNVELTEDLVKRFTSTTETLFLVSPKGKIKPESIKGAKLLSDAVTDQQIKTKVATLLAKYNINLGRDELLKLYQSITVPNEQGKERLSPLLYGILERRMQALATEDPQESEKLLKDLLSATANQVNQWDILTNLFNPHKDRQHAYFTALIEVLSPYEVISFAKTTVFVALAILHGRKDGIDNTSIATKLGKHPFYISSLAKTISERDITIQKLHRAITRLMNLELALKSGKFDDEQFGLDILLATM